jgi:hypothetical protein
MKTWFRSQLPCKPFKTFQARFRGLTALCKDAVLMRIRFCFRRSNCIPPETSIKDLVELNEEGAIFVNDGQARG